jgi:hypothetical protein
MLDLSPAASVCPSKGAGCVSVVKLLKPGCGRGKHGKNAMTQVQQAAPED